MPVVTAAATATAGPRQLSDNNPSGTSLGASATDLISFFNQTPQTQPTLNALQAFLRGGAAGSVTTYSTTQSPSIVNTITGGERAMTVQTGTGFTMQPATTDLFYVNKPTAQAGLGVCNVRVSSANTVQVGFLNPSAGNITPTGSEVYKLVAVRGIPTVALTLSPASVAANSITEQQFTITPTAALPQGVSPGQLVQVSKPTNQAGLDIVGCRVVSNNVIGISFANVTAAPIVPTASEVYTVFATAGLDALNNLMHYGMNMGTIGATGPGVVITGGSTTLTGALATDMLVGIQKPTLQAAATNASMVYPGGSVFTADTFTLGTFGVGTGGTLTGSEVYGLTAYRLNPTGPISVFTQALTPVSVAANTTAEQTFSISSPNLLPAGSSVWINKPSWQAGLGIAGVRVSAANTLAVTYINTTSAAIVPTAETYVIGALNQVAPGAGNCVYQHTAAGLERTTAFVQALRAALSSATGGLGLFNGT